MWKPGEHHNVGMIVALLALAALGGVNSNADEAEAPKSGGSLGVTGENLDYGWRDRQDYWAKGILVKTVTPGGPVDRANIVAGDVIVSVGSKVLKSTDDLSLVESQLEPGQAVSLVVARNGGRQIRIVNVEPDQPPGQVEDQTRVGVPEESTPAPKVLEAEGARSVGESSESDEVPVPRAATATGADLLGARCQTMNPDLAAALGAPEGRGVLLLEVHSGGGAARAGIRAGDVITRVGDQAVDTAEELHRVLETGPSVMTLQVIRQGTERNVQLSVAEEQPGDAEEPEVSKPAQDATADPAAQGEGEHDRLLLQLRDEVRQLQVEVKKLRAELEDLKRM